VVGSGNKTPSGPGFFSQLVGGAKDTAQDVKGSAKEAAGSAQASLPDVKDLPGAKEVQGATPNNFRKPGGGIFGSLMGGPEAGIPPPFHPASTEICMIPLCRDVRTLFP